MIDERSLIKKIGQGNSEALSVLMETYADFVFGVCMSVVKQHHLAEEAAQDCFIKVFRYAGGFKGDSSVKTWLYKIAYRTSLDYYKKNQKGRTELLETNTASVANNAESTLYNNDRDRQIAEMLEVLDERSKEVVTLFYLNEKKIDEIAEMLSLEKSNVKIILFRSRKKLQAAFKGAKIEIN